MLILQGIEEMVQGCIPATITEIQPANKRGQFPHISGPRTVNYQELLVV
jgi:hypothetical protein